MRSGFYRKKLACRKLVLVDLDDVSSILYYKNIRASFGWVYIIMYTHVK